MTIRDEDMPIQVTVFCDECGIRETKDYWVPAGISSLVVARRHLGENAGWHITAGEDLCPDCKPEDGGVPRPTAAWGDWDDSPEGAAEMASIRDELELLPPFPTDDGDD